MIQITLCHNAFLNDTTLKIDSQPIAERTRLAERLNAPMRRWVDDLFILLGEQLNWPAALELHFTGLKADFDDIVQAARVCERSHNLGIRLKHQPVRAAVDRLEALQQLFIDAVDGPLSALRSDDFKKRFEAEIEPNFEVNVIATMSSGKSTLINSLLGQQLLPTKNNACTATIVRIYDRKGGQGFEGQPLSIEGRELAPRGPVDSAQLKRWNSDPQVHQIDLSGAIANVTANPHANLVLVDTPGPNSSLNREHGAATRRAIKDKALPLVLYVLNADQLGTTDDQSLLALVREEMRKGGKQAHDRFVFVLNRIDSIDPEEQSIEESLQEARAHLRDNEIIDAVLLPVSARLAKLVRQQRGGYPLTDTERDDYLPSLSRRFSQSTELHMLQYMNVSASVRDQAEALLAKAERSHHEHALVEQHSGVPVLELVIEEYLDKYALPDRVYRTQRLLDVALQQAEEEARAIEDLKHKSQAELQALQAELQRIEASIRQGDDLKALKETLRTEHLGMPATARGLLHEGQHLFDTRRQALIQTLIKGSDDKHLAAQQARMATAQATELLLTLIATIEKALEQAVQDDHERLGKAFQSYIDRLFNNESGLVRLPSMKSFKGVALTLPSIDRLLEKHTQNELVGHRLVSTRVLYKPWTWFDDDIKVPIYQTKTNLATLARDFDAELRNRCERLLKEASKAIADQSKETIADYIEAIEVRISQELPHLLHKAAEAAGDTEIRQLRIAEAERSLAWIANFKDKLASILD